MGIRDKEETLEGRQESRNQILPPLQGLFRLLSFPGAALCLPPAELLPPSGGLHQATRYAGDS